MSPVDTALFKSFGQSHEGFRPLACKARKSSENLNSLTTTAPQLTDNNQLVAPAAPLGDGKNPPRRHVLMFNGASWKTAKIIKK